MPKRVRIKVFTSWHSKRLEQEINEWIATWEARGYIPVIERKETRLAVSNGKTAITVTFLYWLAPYVPDDDPTAEVNMDA